MVLQLRVPLWLLVLSATCIVGCSGLGGKNSSADLLNEDGRFETTTAIEFEDRLRGQVERNLNVARGRGDETASRLIFKKPYYYKEYAEYPPDSAGFSLDFTEKESRTSPMSADATFEKIRFATRLHDKKNEARSDVNFIRDTGSETVSYELRNGKWHRVSSLYVAEKTEEFMDGAWRGLDETPVLPSLETVEKPGFWSRMKFWK